MYHNAVFWNPAPDSPGLLIECVQNFFPEQIALCIFLLVVTLDKQAVDYTNRIFSSSKTPNRQIFCHIQTHTQTDTIKCTYAHRVIIIVHNVIKIRLQCANNS